MTDDMAAQSVLAALGRGRDAAKPISAIAEELDWPRRMVESAVQSLRLEGWPVASGSDGVWLGDWRDLDATYRTLRHRIVAQSVTAWAVRRSMRRLRDAAYQQQTLGLEEAA